MVFSSEMSRGRVLLVNSNQTGDQTCCRGQCCSESRQTVTSLKQDGIGSVRCLLLHWSLIVENWQEVMRDSSGGVITKLDIHNRTAWHWCSTLKELSNCPSVHPSIHPSIVCYLYYWHLMIQFNHTKQKWHICLILFLLNSVELSSPVSYSSYN